ncbi:Protein CBG04664 [Caenorhabditis briggsae]|uniref:Protein CBG04664 n=1 Tax=Caenorhabditis briggsae TaxID=6238 RepID=A8WY67_CAEBR|nr:Protein CBG04664 [Caenorhabditis briggsae]CAP25325.2 Protein CBG04664 [Caenorhabditis briggsae]
MVNQWDNSNQFMLSNNSHNLLVIRTDAVKLASLAVLAVNVV